MRGGCTGTTFLSLKISTQALAVIAHQVASADKIRLQKDGHFVARTSTRKNVDEVTAISDHEVTEASEDRRGRDGLAAQRRGPRRSRNGQRTRRSRRRPSGVVKIAWDDREEDETDKRVGKRRPNDGQTTRQSQWHLRSGAH